MAGKFFIGTSGWVYQHWKGAFYPEELTQSKWFDFYSQRFSTVEINNTFYHLPKETTFINWQKAAPKDFTFAVKANRFITHIKKLRECKEPIQTFLGRARLLKANLGPILWQLPPRWNCNVERMEEFLACLPKGYRHVFEFRDSSWFNQDIYKLLEKKRAAFCIFNMPAMETPHVVTSSFVYIRFHGGSALYGSRYTEKQLQPWAREIKGYLKEDMDTYVYFNNDAHGYAIQNAGELIRLL